MNWDMMNFWMKDGHLEQEDPREITHLNLYQVKMIMETHQPKYLLMTKD